MSFIFKNYKILIQIHKIHYDNTQRVNMFKFTKNISKTKLWQVSKKVFCGVYFG